MITKGRARVVVQAQAAAAAAETWADLSNFLFNPTDGLLTKAYPNRREREAFQKTADYKHILKLLTDAMSGERLIEGATPRKSGKFVVRLPRTLHAALEQEASEEGVSLNQLVVFKLAAQLNPKAIRVERRHTATLH